jgi:hypothetical protein
MKRPFRTLSIGMVLVLAAVVLVEFAADGLQAFGTRGTPQPADFVLPNLRGNGF